MIRLASALAWMRWRILVNSVARRRKSAASARVAGWLAIGSTALLSGLGLLIALALAAGGVLGGALLAGPEPPRAEMGLALRLLGFAALMIGLVTPLQVGEDRAPTRLLLLPVRRAHLHAARILSCAADPLVRFTVPAVLATLAGLALGGKVLAALIALPAALALGAFLVGFDALATIGAQLLLRDRRRGEAASLVVLLLMVLLGFVPMLVATRLDPDPPAHSSSSEGAHRAPLDAAGIERTFGAFDLLPPGLFARSLDRAIDGRTAAALGTGALLAAIAAGTLALASVLHARLLDEPGSTSKRSRRRGFPVRSIAVPGIQPATLAVARIASRQAWRTVRGKLAVVTPAIIVAVMGFAFRQIGEPAAGLGMSLTSSSGLVSWAIALALLNLQPLWLNAHATDRAGFTLLTLQPVSARHVVAGKRLAQGLLLTASVLLALPPALAIGSPSSPGDVGVALVSGCAAALVQGPLALILSAWFPKEADLSKLSGQQPHAAATTLGLLGMLAVMLLPRLAWFLGSLSGTAAAWAALLAVVALAALLGQVLAGVAASELRARHEDIALAARGR